MEHRVGSLRNAAHTGGAVALVLMASCASLSESQRGTVPASGPSASGPALSRPFGSGSSGSGQAQPASARVRTEGFPAYCERLLLVRRSHAAGATDLEAASSWFGGVVPLDPQDDLASALPELLVAMHRIDTGTEADRTGPLPHWAVARLIALRRATGETAFTEGLRLFVDRHRHGEPVGMDAWLDAMASQAPGIVPEFAAQWLVSPRLADVRTQHRFDASRSRLLLRVDQVHEVSGSARAAFTFPLTVALQASDGTRQLHTVDVDRRRHMFELEAESEPARIYLDPEGALRGLVRIDREADAPAGAAVR